jgi:hypothetical protein
MRESTPTEHTEREASIMVCFGETENVSRVLSRCFKFILPSNLTKSKPRLMRCNWMMSRNLVNWENTTVLIELSLSRVATGQQILQIENKGE